MTVMPIIMDLADQGVFPYVNGKKVVLTPAARMTDVLRHRVRVNKQHLMSALVHLQRLADPDWPAFEAYPARLKAFAEMVMISEMREQGIVPDHYSATTECKRCGPVAIFEGCPSEVGGCPWCFNRRKGLPIPRAPHSEEYEDE